jgi:hypothetical protein
VSSATICLAAAQCLPLDVRKRIVKLAIDRLRASRRRRFLEMLAVAPEAYTSPLRRPQGWPWVRPNGGVMLEESFGDLMVGINVAAPADEASPGRMALP